MTKKISKPMMAFLKQYLEWAESDATIESSFDINQALCGNLIEWTNIKAGMSLSNREFFHLRWELTDMFERSGLNTCYPFGGFNYSRERENKSHHRSPIRLEWIRKQLGGNDV